MGASKAGVAGADVSASVSPTEETPCGTKAPAACKSTKKVRQQELMEEIQLAFKRCRWDAKDDTATAKTEMILSAIRQAVKLSPCNHDDVLLCYTCAKDSKQSTDGMVLHEGHTTGYKLSHCGPSYQELVANRLRSAFFAEGHIDCQFAVMTNDFVQIPSHAHLQARRTIAEKISNGIEQLSATESVAVYWTGFSRLEGMQLVAPSLLTQNRIVDRACEYVVLHPTFYSKPSIDSRTFTYAFACTHGSVVVTMWPGSVANLVSLGLATRKGEDTFLPFTQSLRAPHVVFLQAGEMVVLPPMTIFSMVALKASILLNWRAVPAGMLDGSCREMVYDRFAILQSLARGHEEYGGNYEDDLLDEISDWQSFQQKHCVHGDADASAAESVIEKLKTFSNVQSEST